PNSTWQQVATICIDDTGPASLIRTSQGSLEIAAREGSNLYAWNNAGGWHRDTLTGPGGLIATGVTGQASLIQSNFGAPGSGNYEVIVQRGLTLSHYWHDNTRPGSSWQFGETLPAIATGSASLIQTAKGSLEVVVPEGTVLVAFVEDLSAA